MNKQFIPLLLVGSALISACDQKTTDESVTTTAVPTTTTTTAAAAVAPVANTNVAIVNQVAITQLAFDKLQSDIAARSRGQNIPKDRLLKELISRELLKQEAAKLNLKDSPQVTAQIDEIKQSLLIQAVLKNYVDANPASAKALKVEYDKKVASMKATEYKARHILLKEEAEAKAVIEELNKGGDFAELAKTKSTGPSATNGGDLGWFAAGQMVPEFSEAVAKLEDGKFTQQAVKTQFGWHIIIREESRDKAIPSFEEMKESLKPLLQQQQIETYFVELRNKAQVKITEATPKVEAKPTDIVVKVNGTAITQADFDKFEAEIKKRSRGQSLPKAKLLEEIIRRQLLMAEAKTQNLQDSEDIKKRLAEIQTSLLPQAVIQEHLDKTPITDEQLKAEYDKKVGSVAGDEYKARHILLKEETEAKAVIEALNKGGDFAELAKTKSTGPSATKGGDLGWFGAGQMVPEFSAAVAQLKNGKYSTEPVKSQFGWHVILREDMRVKKSPPFDSVKEQLRSMLQQQQVQTYLETLRKNAQVEILIKLEEAKPPAPVIAPTEVKPATPVADKKPAEKAKPAPSTTPETATK